MVDFFVKESCYLGFAAATIIWDFHKCVQLIISKINKFPCLLTNLNVAWYIITVIYECDHINCTLLYIGRALSNPSYSASKLLRPDSCRGWCLFLKVLSAWAAGWKFSVVNMRLVLAELWLPSLKSLWQPFRKICRIACPAPTAPRVTPTRRLTRVSSASFSSSLLCAWGVFSPQSIMSTAGRRTSLLLDSLIYFFFTSPSRYLFWGTSLCFMKVWCGFVCYARNVFYWKLAITSLSTYIAQYLLHKYLINLYVGSYYVSGYEPALLLYWIR